MTGKQLVAPFAGAWIEIEIRALSGDTKSVAPFAGAWIEIAFSISTRTCSRQSLPSRERGLKSVGDHGWKC